MANYTNGEWKVIEPQGDPDIYNRIVVVACAENEVPRLIAELGFQRETRSNAALISAAPEMFKALLLALGHLQASGYRGEMVEKQVRAAIAKATAKK